MKTWKDNIAFELVSPYDIRRVFTFYREAQQLRQGKMCRPRMGLVYTSRICNHGCYYCSDGETNKFLEKLMSPELLLRLPQELKGIGAESVELCGGGEPLMHPMVNDFIRKCVNIGLKLGTLTNAAMIKNELLELIAKHFSYVRVSLDSFNEKMYNKIRKPKNKNSELKTVLKNIKALTKRKKQLKSPLLVGIKTCFDINTLPEMHSFIGRSIELGADSVTIKMARNTGEKIPEKIIKYYQRKLNNYKKLSRNRISVMGNLQKTHIDHKCWLAPFHVFIDTDGSLRICCYFQNRTKLHTYGNISNKSLKEVWYSKEHLDAMKKVKIEECQAYDCKYHGYHAVMKEAFLDNKAQWEFV